MLGNTGAEIRGHKDAWLSWLTSEGKETFLLWFMGYRSFFFTVCFIYKLTMHMIYHGSCKHHSAHRPFPSLNCDLIIFTGFIGISFQVRCKFLLSAFCQSVTYPPLKHVLSESTKSFWDSMMKGPVVASYRISRKEKRLMLSET